MNTENFVQVSSTFILLVIGAGLAFWLISAGLKNIRTFREGPVWKRADYVRYEKALSDRARVRQKIGFLTTDEDEYEELVFEVERISDELHMQALKDGSNPWDVYHPRIRELMQGKKEFAKPKVVPLRPASDPPDGAA